MDEQIHRISFIKNILDLSQHDFIEYVNCDLQSRVTIINKIKATRKNRKISQTELAKLAGCSRQTISSVESFNSSPGADILLSMIKALNMNLDIHIEFKLKTMEQK
ncbi:XRE family transcriptional regulator [Apilactobacillus timberlakei]|uniref:helix-turn-helix transcriptional regulator n=1 Tax=Apilactobacillus timberlakei TaxID=2008380 RepID=UPI001129B252|nr:helix-turn-helix transcriptional regulator [Apilactobacillus timberlakei]TPR14949.1 XRE family transcriptional regulator [Apilactobacillus timberlakei]